MGDKALPWKPTKYLSAASTHLWPFSGGNSPHFVATPLPAHFEQHVSTLESSPSPKLSSGAGQRVPCHGNLARGRGEAGKTRPRCSYGCMIGMALRSSPTQTMLAKEIYAAIESLFPELRESPPNGWKNSVRHCLSLGQFFRKVTKDEHNNGNCGRQTVKKGFLWEPIPEKKEALNKEIEKFLTGIPKAFPYSDHVSTHHKPAAVGVHSTATQCDSTLSQDVVCLLQGFQNSDILLVPHSSATPVPLDRASPNASGVSPLPDASVVYHSHDHIGPASPINSTNLEVYPPVRVDLPSQEDPWIRSGAIIEPTTESLNTTTDPQIAVPPLPDYRLLPPLQDCGLPASSSVINPPPPPSPVNNDTAGLPVLSSDLHNVECDANLTVTDDAEWQAILADLRPIPEDLYPPEFIAAYTFPDTELELGQCQGYTPDPLFESPWQHWQRSDQSAHKESSASMSVPERSQVDSTAGCSEQPSNFTLIVEDSPELIEQFWREQFSLPSSDYDVSTQMSSSEPTQDIEDRLLSMRDLEELDADVEFFQKLLGEIQDEEVEGRLLPPPFNTCQTSIAADLRPGPPDSPAVPAVASHKRKREDAEDDTTSEEGALKRARLDLPPSLPLSHCSETVTPSNVCQRDGCLEQPQVKTPHVMMPAVCSSTADLDCSVYSMLDADSVARLEHKSRTQELEAIFIDSEDIYREMHSYQGLSYEENSRI